MNRISGIDLQNAFFSATLGLWIALVLQKNSAHHPGAFLAYASVAVVFTSVQIFLMWRSVSLNNTLLRRVGIHAVTLLSSVLFVFALSRIEMTLYDTLQTPLTHFFFISVILFTWILAIEVTRAFD